MFSLGIDFHTHPLLVREMISRHPDLIEAARKTFYIGNNFQPLETFHLELDAAGLGKAMRENPAVPSCIVNRLYSYAAGRTPLRDEKKLLAYFEKNFASASYRLPELLREIAVSKALYAIAPQAAPSAALISRKDDKS